MNKLVKIAIVVAVVSYFSHFPAPENSPNPWITTTVITIVRAVFGLAAHLGNLGYPELGLKIARGLTAPTPCIDAVDEKIIELDNFVIHVFTPKDYVGNRGAIINFHGGGWVVGNVPGNAQYFSSIADEAGTVVVAPEYRLAPEHPYPAAIDDCLETVKYVFDNAEDLNINKNKIVVTGDSAGGHLALVTALGLAFEEDYRLKGVVPVYPVTQGASVMTRSYEASDNYLISKAHMGWFISQWLTGSADHADDWLSGKIFKEVLRRSPASQLAFDLDEQIVPEPEEFETDEEFELRVERIMDYRVSPLLAPMEMLLELPTTVIYVCEHDVLKDDGVMMIKQLEDIGHINAKIHELKGGIHGTFILSRQATGMNMHPKSTLWVSAYIKRMKIMTD